jgi:aryl-alcohol dehydrogenase-like predicted oxidoreductase
MQNEAADALLRIDSAMRLAPNFAARRGTRRIGRTPSMNFRALGRSGLMVSPLAIGSFNFSNPTSEAESIAIVERAYAAGVNFFDTSNNYNEGQSEIFLGRAIRRLPGRHKVVIASKVHFPIDPSAGPNEQSNSRVNIIRACEESLERLGTDYIDLYQLHRPSFHVPTEETLGAMTDLIRQGKVRYIGCSTHPAWKVVEGVMVSEAKGLARYISEQPPYNLLDRRIENELVPACLAHGIGLIPYAPLAQGVLSGRYADATSFPADSRAARRGGVYIGRVNAPGIEIGRKLTAIAKQAGITPAQLAVLWVKDQPAVTAPIFGPRTIVQLEEILPVMTMTLSPQLAAACDALVPPGSAVTNYHNGCTWMKQQLQPGHEQAAATAH